MFSPKLKALRVMQMVDPNRGFEPGQFGGTMKLATRSAGKGDTTGRRAWGAYMVPEGGVLHRVLGSQGDAAEQDEEEDEVGEDCVIDDTVALEAEPAGRERRQSCQDTQAELLSGPQELLPSVLCLGLCFGSNP